MASLRLAAIVLLGACSQNGGSNGAVCASGRLTVDVTIPAEEAAVDLLKIYISPIGLAEAGTFFFDEPHVPGTTQREIVLGVPDLWKREVLVTVATKFGNATGNARVVVGDSCTARVSVCACSVDLGRRPGDGG